MDEGAGQPLPMTAPCDTIASGYQCNPSLSRSWGQYSPYYLVPSDLPTRTPTGCKVSMVQLLSRHGARYPTTDKSLRYNETISKVQLGATNLTGIYEFLQGYTYNLGAEDLTPLGQQELVNAGIDFFYHYESLAIDDTPFIRAGDQDRVVASAKKWSEGFHKAKIRHDAYDDRAYPYNVVEISEADNMNNTLHHSLCTAFEVSNIGEVAQRTFGDTFLPSITARLKHDMNFPGLGDLDTLSLMDLCPFTTVADFDPFSSVSPSSNPLCALFGPSEWEQYDYFQTLGKYYRFGPGAPLGPTQGVGYVNELIARLTNTPAKDSTSVNHTLDANDATFPLGKSLYADFSHDNDMTAIFAALGLFDAVPELSTKKVMSVEEMGGYAASRSVPFGGRAVVEKLTCERPSKGEMVKEEEMVRVILNGGLWPLEACQADERGMCTLANFVESLSFAREGGKWDQCFTVERAPTIPVVAETA